MYLGLANDILDSPLIFCLFLSQKTAGSFSQKLKDNTEVITSRVLINNSFFQVSDIAFVSSLNCMKVPGLLICFFLKFSLILVSNFLNMTIIHVSL